MTRLRHRPDYFEWRGLRMAFHRLQDGPTLGRLDPYSEGEQTWLLNSGRPIDVTAAEIRDITFQVHGIELPAVNPDLKFITDPTLEPRIAALEKLVSELAERFKAAPEPVVVAEPEVAPEPEPVVIEEAPAEPAPDPQQEIDALKDLVAEQAAELARLREDRPFPTMTEKLADYDAVGDEANLTTADLTEDVIQRLTKAKRKKFTELLNVELAELQQERGGPREDLKRENEIEALLGLFARVGEM